MNERPLKVSASTTNAEFSTLVEILRWRALNHPDQKAYTFLSDREEEHSLTYAELDRQARAIGAMISSWKVAFCGAEPIRYQTLLKFAEYFAPCGFRAEALRPAYGLAEAALFSVINLHLRGSGWGQDGAKMGMRWGYHAKTYQLYFACMRGHVHR